MLLFRSEEHLQGWLTLGNPEGERMTLTEQWDLARLWFSGRHLPNWQKRGTQEAEALFAAVGLISEFWSFA